MTIEPVNEAINTEPVNESNNLPPEQKSSEMKAVETPSEDLPNDIEVSIKASHTIYETN